MSIKSDTIEKYEFPINYEIHIMGRPIDLEEYTLTVCFFAGIDDVVEYYLQQANYQNGYRDFLIWELRWSMRYSVKDLSILTSLSETTIRRILNKIDKIVWDHRDEWFEDKSGLS